MTAPEDQAQRPANPFTAFFQEVRDDLRHNNGGPAWTWQDAATFVFITVLMGIFYYYCRPGFFRGSLFNDTAQLLSLDRSDPWTGLLPYGWWALMSIIMRMLVPCLFIVFVLKDRVRDYGYRLIGTSSHGLIYLGLFVGMLPIVYGISYTKSFQSKYPFYDNAILGWEHFVSYQLLYGIQFLALEAFFRGFVIFALFKRFGYYSLLIMAIPYCMIHFGKPAAETFGAILAGIALGYLALKSRSFLYGALLHWGIGIAMDLFAIIQKGGFKS